MEYYSEETSRGNKSEADVQKLIAEKISSIKFILCFPVVAAVMAVSFTYGVYGTIYDFYPFPVTLVFGSFIFVASYYCSHLVSLKLKKYCPEAFKGYMEGSCKVFYCFCLSVVFVCVSAMLFSVFRSINVAFDTSSPKSYVTQVTDKCIKQKTRHSRYSSTVYYVYYIYTAPIKGISSGLPIEFEINEFAYRDYKIGDTVKFEIRKGASGFPYVSRGDKYLYRDEETSD